MEIKDDDSSDEDEHDNIPAVTITQREMHALMEEREEEEDKVEEAHEEEKDEDYIVRIAVEAIGCLPHTPQNTVTSVELASTSEIASTTVTSSTQSALSTSQLQGSTMEVPSTSSTELSVTSSTELAIEHPISISTVLTHLLQF